VFDFILSSVPVGIIRIFFIFFFAGLAKCFFNIFCTRSEILLDFDVFSFYCNFLSNLKQFDGSLYGFSNFKNFCNFYFSLPYVNTFNGKIIKLQKKRTLFKIHKFLKFNKINISSNGNELFDLFFRFVTKGFDFGDQRIFSDSVLKSFAHHMSPPLDKSPDHPIQLNFNNFKSKIKSYLYRNKLENIKIDQDLFSSFKSLKTSLPSYSDEAFKLFFSQLKKPREPANLNGELLSGKPLNLNFSNFCIKVKLIFPQVSPTLETFKTFFSFISSKKDMSINKIYAEETIRDFFNNLNSFNNLCLKFIEFCSKSKKPAIFDRNTHFIPLWNFPNKSNKIPYSDLSILYNTLRDFKIENYKKDNTAPPKTKIPKNQHSSKPTTLKSQFPQI